LKNDLIIKLWQQHLAEIVDTKYGMDYHIQALIDRGLVRLHPWRRMRFGTLEIEPQKNPAVLDTATWDTVSAWHSISEMDESFFMSVLKAIRERHSLPLDKRCVVYAGSCAEYRDRIYGLAKLADGQHVFIEIETGSADSPLKEPIGIRSLSNGTRLAAHRADITAIDCYVSLIRCDKGPKALGVVPRLGIGSRMSTTAWPGIWRAMEQCNFQANPIQNSVREVNLLQDILAGKSARLNYLANFGRLEEGHTGSTFQGLWVAGVLEALKVDSAPPYGADADHITVRRGADDIAHAKRVIEAARLYTFFTLDVSDLLDHDAISGSPQKRKDLVCKYGRALDVAEQLANHLVTVKEDAPFDLELSIDETPSGVDAFTCLTSEAELVFLIRDLQRRRIPVTHIAPNFGIEKGFDYRGRDGLIGLEKRIQGLYRCARDFGVLLDCHSGDDLRAETRRIVGCATEGNVHFKISPELQIIFADVLNEFDPKLFCFWWEDTLDYARREAAAGSDFAAFCLRQYETSNDRKPSPNHVVFHYYGFATVGQRDDKGQFIHRHKFYELPQDFYRLYQDRVVLYLSDVASDVFGNVS